MLNSYKEEAVRRIDNDLPPLPLTPEQTRAVTELLEQGSDEGSLLCDLLSNRVEPGVSKSAKVKAVWLEKVARQEIRVDAVSSMQAVLLLSSMGGGYNVDVLIELLEIPEFAPLAAAGLKQLIKIYDGFDRVKALAGSNRYAKEILISWSKAEWFTESAALPDSVRLTIYKVDGEINTDDFSPGNQAQSRADIPLHAQFFGGTRFPEGIVDIEAMKATGAQVAFAGDVVGTGSSRKSAINSLLWHTGEEIPFVPNKRTGGFVLGGTIAPIFYATARDAGILPIECEME